MTDAFYNFDPCNYEKEPLMLRLCSGEEVVCWPNAGTLHALDGSGRMFKGHEYLMVRKAVMHECPGFGWSKKKC